MQRRHAEPLDRLAVLRGRVADVLGELPARDGWRRRGACSGRASPWRSPRRRRSRRSWRRRRSPRADRGRVAPTGKPSLRQMQPVAARPSKRVAERGEVRHVQAAGVDPGRAARHDRDLRGDAQDHREQLGARLGRLLLGVVERAERTDLGRARSRRGRTARAAATSGPARQPRPASSAPATNRTPSDAVEPEQPAGGRRALAPRRTAAAPLARLEEADPVRGPVREERDADEPFARDRAPETAVVRIATVVAHHEVVAGRNLDRFAGNCTQESPPQGIDVGVLLAARRCGSRGR